jgi:hypothetical protein
MSVRTFKLLSITSALLAAAPAQAANFWPRSAHPLTTMALKRYPTVSIRGIPGSFIQVGDQLFPRGRTLFSGFSGAPWPGGKLIYRFDSSVTAAEQKIFTDSCALWAAAAKVSCVARSSEPVYVVVRSGAGNNSSVGMPSSGLGSITIKDWNNSYIVAHEIGHSLGLDHEQNRSDRDTYVKILIGNVQAGKEHDFDKDPSSENMGTKYDFDSVMHYKGNAFGKKDANGNVLMTIQVLPPNQPMQGSIGQRTHLSSTDKAGMAARYGAPLRGVRKRS